MWLSIGYTRGISGISSSVFAFKPTMDTQDEAFGRNGSQVSRHLWTSRVTPMSSKLPVAFTNTALGSTGSVMLWPVIVSEPGTLTHTLGAGCPPPHPNLLPLVHLLTIDCNLSWLTSLESQFPKHLFIIYWWVWKMIQNQKPLYIHRYINKSISMAYHCVIKWLPPRHNKSIFTANRARIDEKNNR